MYETALLNDAREEVNNLRTADIVIGIPSYRNARTIGAVTRNAVQGALSNGSGGRIVVVNVDANSSDGTANTFMRLRLPTDVRRFTTGYNGLTGQGSAVRAVMEVAAHLGAKACIVLDAALTDLQPKDVEAMLRPVLNGQTHLVIPMHQWDYVDAAFEDLIVHPMLRFMYGRRVRRPLSGSWALSGKLAYALSDQDVWETDAARSGLDAWMLVTALANDVSLVEVPSCRKHINLVFGTTAYDQRFTHTVSTLLRHLGPHQRIWREVNRSKGIVSAGMPPCIMPPTEKPIDDFWKGIKQGIRTYRRVIRRIVEPDTFQFLQSIAKGTPERVEFPDEVWARIVLDFGICFNKAELDPDKVAAALAVPYYARCLSFWREIEENGIEQYEAIVERQSLQFEKQRDYMIDRWDSYVAWVPDAPIR